VAENRFYSTRHPVLAVENPAIAPGPQGQKYALWDEGKVRMVYSATADKPGSPRQKMQVEDHSKDVKAVTGFDGYGHASEFSNKMYMMGYAATHGKPGELKRGKSGRYDDHCVVCEHGY
jgi:hypothetical protein